MLLWNWRFSCKKSQLLPFLQNLLFLRNGHGVKCFGHLEKGRLNLPVTEPVVVGLILLTLFRSITSVSLLLFTGSASGLPDFLNN